MLVLNNPYLQESFTRVDSGAWTLYTKNTYLMVLFGPTSTHEQLAVHGSHFAASVEDGLHAVDVGRLDVMEADRVCRAAIKAVLEVDRVT